MAEISTVLAENTKRYFFEYENLFQLMAHICGLRCLAKWVECPAGTSEHTNGNVKG